MKERMRCSTRVGVVVCGVWSLVGLPAGADNAHLMQLIEILHKKGTLSHEEYQLLRGAADAPPEKTDQTTGRTPHKADSSVPQEEAKRVAAAAPAAPEPDSPVDITTKGGIKVKSRSGDSEFTLGGRVQVDAGFYRDDVRDHASGTELRRARLDVGGRVDRDWKFKLAYDFAENAVEDKAAYIAYGGWPLATVKAGLYTPPFTLSEATSSLYTTFMEEPMLVNAFKPDDRIAIGVESGGGRWSAQAAVFGENPGPNAAGEDESHGVSLRLTGAPLLDPENFLHLGGALLHQNPDSQTTAAARFRARPEAHVGTKRLVDTGSIAKVDGWTQYGLEFAAGRGPFSLESEYVLTAVERAAGLPNLHFDGYYAGVGWFLTGEARVYEAQTGSFGRIKPRENFSLEKGGLGAWQVAARYSMLDLTDGSVLGGEEKNVTLGVNWYLNPQVRLMTNYLWVDAEKAGVHDQPGLFQTRAQVDF
ncbi:MAG: OprO/OprP family phosphate-selective porin [Magnetococcus sp. MYC-9]